jgi:hypothetical protein
LVGSAKRRIVNPDSFEEHGRPLGSLHGLENHRVALPADPDTFTVETKIVRQLNGLRALEFNDLSSFHGVSPSDSEAIPASSL